MKNLLFVLFGLTCANTFAQSSGSIVAKEPKPMAAKENVYIYTPPKGLIVPDSSLAYIFYNKGNAVSNKKVQLLKEGNNYSFMLKTWDSSKVFVAGITDKKGNLIDTRNKKGYIVYLYDNGSNEYPGSKINAAQLLNRYCRYYLKTKVPADSLLAFYDADYKLHPAEKKNSGYLDYLNILYKVKKEAAKPVLLSYIQEQTQTDAEANWYNAYNVYQTLGMKDKKDSLGRIIITKWPLGPVASGVALDSIYKENDLEQRKVLINSYKQRFGNAYNDNFNEMTASGYASEKNWDQYYVYTDAINNKFQKASMLNNTAWDLSGGSVEATGDDLEFAKKISALSVNIIAEQMNDPEKYKPDDIDDISDFEKSLKNSYDTYIDTYALLLFKLNQPDSAFYYQDIAIQNSKDPEMFERYAAYAEKAKGSDFARKFLESKFMEGYSNAGMKKQLKIIYQQQNLSEADFDSFIANANAARIEKLKEELRQKMKDEAAKGFSLKNLEGQTVSLSSLKGKIVVVDFWATWCGPCKASFPAMQQALNKYKDDNDVVFLFVDTWENKEMKAMQADAQNFIRQNNYTFNVLLDNENQTIANYQVDGIPTKFIINKDGKVKFISVGFSGDDDALVDEISLMIDMAKDKTM